MLFDLKTTAIEETGSSYSYPDEQDRLICQFIKEKDERYWIESENAIIDLIKSHLETNRSKAPGKFLDAGCGTGRLIPRFEEYFDKIVGIEPDRQRCEQAIDYIESQNLTHKTRLVNTGLQTYRALSEDRYDFILCSHVIQHIDSGEVNPFLAGMADLLRENGLLVITTNHATRPYNYFYKSYIKNGMTATEEIPEDEFNQIIYGKEVLPVQFFNYDNLVNYLSTIGLKVLEFRVFHIDDKDRDLVRPDLSDDYFNATAERQRKFGADMLILLQKS